MRALAAQGLAGELNALAVVDETVEDGIGVSGTPARARKSRP